MAPSRSDEELVQIVDAAVADAARRSGGWLLCRPGCTQCCLGPFPIGEGDAERLRRGLRALERSDEARAARVERRARDFVQAFASSFPGNPASGVLDESEAGEERFVEFANDEPCPALDLDTGTCDVYAWRPLTCRTFGPPMRTNEGVLGVCELCYVGASDEEIARCEVQADVEQLEGSVHRRNRAKGRKSKRTIVAWALAKAR